MATVRTIIGINDGSDDLGNQQVSAGANVAASTSVSSSAISDVSDNLTLSEINALTPEKGAQVYDTTNDVLRYWNGVIWKEVTSEGTINDDILDNRVIVNQVNFLTTICGTIDSTKDYFLDGVINIGANTVTVPSTGLTVSGYSFDLSGLISTEAGVTLITSDVGGSGNLLLENIYLTASGVGSKVFDLTDATGFNALEFNKINYIDCSSLGTITSYRQILESGTGRFGGAPSLTLAGNMVGGMRITTTITRNISALTGALFAAGAGLVINGRFITDMNVDLGASASLIDFAPSNMANNESLIISSAFVARNGVLDPTDTTVHPNISASDKQSLWSKNSGISNTYKYAQQTITTEATTAVASADTYYPLAGTWTLGEVSHFDSPANGQIRCLSGNDVYRVSGNFVLDSDSGDVVGLRIVKSTDGGSNWTEVNHIKREISNLQGGRDVAYFQIDFLVRLADGDIIRLEVENYDSTADITAELDSYLTISAT